ncbi:MAG: Prolyl 4-hydroxylase alpha-2 subunit [Trebouxia sp. A1-2]|nr:MAG: Prolyl 4-hydroxylase alpha-2 subunit [Trebouxia sp. A1-2]
MADQGLDMSARGSGALQHARADHKSAEWRLELRRICLSIRRELQSRVGSTACGPPCQYCSPAFQLSGPSDNLSLQWQLSVIPLELSIDSLSIYVQSVSAQAPDSGLTVRANFSLTMKTTQKAWSVSSAVASTGARQVIYLKDLGQVEQSGYAEIEFTLQSVQTHTALPVPGIIASADPNIILISLQPRILLIENFLSAADCQGIINLASPDLQRSRVAKGDMTPSRTSSSTFLTRKAGHPDIQCFERRVSQLISLPAVMHGRRHLTKGEAVQVVRYQEGEFYAEHFDNKADDCSKRACTIMAYLSDVEAGGETFFRRSSGCCVQAFRQSCALLAEQPTSAVNSHGASMGMPGLRIPPKQGRAIMFW